MNTNGTGSIIPRSTLFFYVNVSRSIGQVGKLEFDEIGQRVFQYFGLMQLLLKTKKL